MSENKIIDFKSGADKVRQLKASGELPKLQEDYKFSVVTGEDFGEDYAAIVDELMWFFFLLSDSEDMETWRPSLPVKFLMLIFEGIIFSELGENQEFQSVFLKHAIETLKIDDIKMFNQE